MKVGTTIFLLFSLLVAVGAIQNHVQRSREIILTNRIIQTVEHEPHTDFTSEEPNLFFIHFKHGFAGDYTNIKAIQDSYKIVFDSYLPHATYVLFATPKIVGKLSNDPNVLWVGLVAPADRVPVAFEEFTEGAAVTFAKTSSDMPTVAETLASLVARMADRFSGFRWEDSQDGSATLLFEESLTPKQRTKILKWVVNNEPRVRFMEPVIFNEPHGMFANAVMLNGDFFCTDSSATTCQPNQYFSSPLSGANVTIAISDSGVDVLNCFFHDASQPVPVNTVSQAHRKIVTYNTALGDAVDFSGHGTFAAGMAGGVAAGNFPALSDAVRFNGIAEGAKFAVFDIQQGNSNFYNIPQNVGAELLTPMVASGARIGLFPWGSELVTGTQGKQFYNLQDKNFDDFIYLNPTFVAVASVGNNGLKGYKRVTSPATAKNTIAVGGSLNDHSSFNFTSYLENADNIARDLEDKYCTIGDTSAYNNQVFCTTQGQSTPCPGYQNILCAGFDGTSASCCNYPYFASLCCSTILSRLYQSQIYSQNAIYPYSSRGPAFDNRVKPDLMAPAQRLFSAKASNPLASAPFCDPWTNNAAPTALQAATVMEGTSFAAGLVAGAAAQVIQWLQEGYYPTGVPTDAVSVKFADPSASLVKALLINSADRLELINGNDAAAYRTPLQQFPSEEQGFGRINLKNTLLSDFNADPNIIILENQRFDHTNQTFRFCVELLETSRFFRATAVWTDPSAAQGAGVALVNNIDLVLVRDDGYEYRANQQDTFDSVNNVEDIRITEFPGRVYTVELYGTYVPSPPQFVSLVIRGDMRCNNKACLLPQSQCTKDTSRCPNDCSLRGSCSFGECICQSPYRGIDCSLTPCPSNCNGNGVCDGETGVCTCNDFWLGLDCGSRNPSGEVPDPNCQVNVKDCESGVDIGITIGVTIGAFFFGAILFFLIGAWAATRIMLQRKKKMIHMYRAAQKGGGAAKPIDVDRDEQDEH